MGGFFFFFSCGGAVGFLQSVVFLQKLPKLIIGSMKHEKNQPKVQLTRGKRKLTWTMNIKIGTYFEKEHIFNNVSTLPECKDAVDQLLLMQGGWKLLHG